MTQTPVSWRAVSDDVLEARPPDVSPTLAAEIARSVFGVEGEATPLEGERDRNFRIDDGGRLVRPQGRQPGGRGGHGRDAGARDGARAAGRPGAADRAAAPHRRRPRRPAPSRSTASTTPSSSSRSSTASPSRPARRPRPRAARSVPPWRASTRRSPGSPTRSPTGACSGTWRGCPSSAPSSRYLAPDRRALVERALDRYEAVVEPALAFVPLSTIHGDVNPGNILVARDDAERVAGIVDFGDLVHARTVIDPAIAAAYQAFGSADPLDPLVEVVTAYHAVRPLTAAELRLVPELAAAADGPVAPHLRLARRAASGQRRLHPRRCRGLLRDARAARRARSRGARGVAGRGVRRPLAAAGAASPRA